ncbi:hypothetical protein GGI21_005453, partial [Coemansia aciculifera]
APRGSACCTASPIPSLCVATVSGRAMTLTSLSSIARATIPAVLLRHPSHQRRHQARLSDG